MVQSVSCARCCVFGQNSIQPLDFSTYRQVLIVLSESEIKKSTCVPPIKDADSYSVTPLVNTLMLHLESDEVERASYLQHNYKPRDGAEGRTK